MRVDDLAGSIYQAPPRVGDAREDPQVHEALFGDQGDPTDRARQVSLTTS